MHRQAKEAKLKKNLEVAKERSKRQYRSNFGTEMPDKQIRSEEKQWEESVNRVDGTMLDKVWNDKDDSKDSGSVRGYFTGISFDSSGKIKRK